jgi:hypothetical protein
MMKTAEIEQNLLDFLTGYARTNPKRLEHVATYSDWQRIARVELDRRATRLLEALTDAELWSIADGKISLKELARRLSL